MRATAFCEPSAAQQRGSYQQGTPCNTRQALWCILLYTLSVGPVILLLSVTELLHTHSCQDPSSDRQKHISSSDYISQVFCSQGFSLKTSNPVPAKRSHQPLS